MVYALVCSIALAASLLTFFTGFGLGTLLLPAMAVFFDTEVAVALTAVVHLLNGLFKLALTGKSADRAVALRFGLPAIAAALAGAWLLTLLARPAPLVTYTLFGATKQVTLVKLVIAGLMIVFAVLELSKRFQELSIPPKWMPLGGVLTGFFGGLSGHQGALRSVFLLRAGLAKEAFIATGVLISVGVDATRLGVYFPRFGAVSLDKHGPLLAAASAAAFAGAFAGSRLLKKVTLTGIQRAVGVLLCIVAVGMAAGLL